MVLYSYQMYQHFYSLNVIITMLFCNVAGLYIYLYYQVLHKGII